MTAKKYLLIGAAVAAIAGLTAVGEVSATNPPPVCTPTVCNSQTHATQPQVQCGTKNGCPVCVNVLPSTPVDTGSSCQFEWKVFNIGTFITAFKMDLVNKRHRKTSDLLTYCRYSANPVGRIVLHLFEYKDPELHRLSDFICTALQLTNFWQDIAIDLEKDRIYIPLEDMERFGYTISELKSHLVNSAFKDLLASEIEFTRGLFKEGAPLCRRVGKGLSLELKAVWSGGMKILEKIEKNGYDVFNKRPVVTTFDKVKIISRALTMRA